MQQIDFQSTSDLEAQLAKDIAQQLRDAINLKGSATLLVSGGSTPKKMFEFLSNQDLDWSKVTIGLVDERFVDATDEASNEKMVKNILLQHHASAAQFIGMVYDTGDYNKNLKLAQKSYSVFIESGVDVCILGMGNDGHTASLFPGDQSSESDLKESQIELLNTTAPVHPTKRITCSKALILTSKKLLLMLIGEAKMKALEEALDQNLPISHFTNHSEFKLYFSL
jgi:6-phosphogluconolactonase